MNLLANQLALEEPQDLLCAQIIRVITNSPGSIFKLSCQEWVFSQHLIDITRGLNLCQVCEYNYKCEQEFKFNGFDKNVPGSVAKLMALMINLISTLSLLAVGLIFIYNRKFKKHPYPLLGYTCIAEAFLYCTMHT